MSYAIIRNEKYTRSSLMGIYRHNERKNTSYTNTISISCIPIYYLEPNTTIYIEDKESSIEGYYVINTISLPLTYNGNMTISASKAITIQ